MKNINMKNINMKNIISSSIQTIKFARATVCLFLLFSFLPLQAAGTQSLASIRLQAEDFIAQYPYETPYLPRFQLGNLDSRLLLKACQKSLAIVFTHENKNNGNTALTVRCPVKPGWKIHLPVSIQLYDDVIVSAKPLVKGQIIDETAMTFQKVDISRLNNGYFLKPNDLNQLQVRRNLPAGAVLTSSNLVPRMLVKSGQQVTLVLNYKGIQIKSSGKALQSAGLGQLVRVRNNQSLKIIEGIVSGESLVKVGI
jgi:flagella basal body P-ring formation protein FlgA